MQAQPGDKPNGATLGVVFGLRRWEINFPGVMAGTALVLVLCFLAACAGKPPGPRPPGYEQTGLASYYAHKFHGRKTASGERYDENALTAAHPSLPFGTRVRVINLRNKRAVIVRINDRGPFIKKRIIDLSYAAARQLKMVGQGVAPVKVVLVK